MWETQVQSLGWEDPLEREMATHSSVFAWRIPWTAEPGWLQAMGSQRVGHDWATSVSLSLGASYKWNRTIFFLCGWHISLSLCFQGSSMLGHVSEFHYFLQTNIVPLYGYTTFLFIHSCLYWWIPGQHYFNFLASVVKIDLNTKQKSIAFLSSHLIQRGSLRALSHTNLLCWKVFLEKRERKKGRGGEKK